MLLPVHTPGKLLAVAACFILFATGVNAQHKLPNNRPPSIQYLLKIDTADLTGYDAPEIHLRVTFPIIRNWRWPRIIYTMIVSGGCKEFPY